MKLPPLALLTLAGVGGLPTAALGHGVILERQATEAIEVTAQYDTGEPLTEAQVLVFSPEDPQNPWSQGRTDDQGRFWFRPDQDLVGTWEVIVRQAGHGGLVTVEVEETGAATAENPAAEGDDSGSSMQSASVNGVNDVANLSPLHRVVLMGTTIWGFIGTALFFWRRKD